MSQVHDNANAIVKYSSIMYFVTFYKASDFNLTIATTHQTRTTELYDEDKTQNQNPSRSPHTQHAENRRNSQNPHETQKNTAVKPESRQKILCHRYGS